MTFPEGMPGPYDLNVDDAVKPGDTHVYKWNITYDIISGGSEDECNPYLFHSHTYDLEKDIHSGPVGVIMACFDDRPIGACM